ncbi:MAG TPA: DUF4340 domain-containing protein [Methylophilaceae bacterium]|nr:DUF4340 domain-containing protein [Methylophilaceae bacterium]HQR60453.1 DUF4340 domain-containing protein [Methylophilaceae bacterium]
MKSRWLLNIALLLLVAGIALALYLVPQQKDATPEKVKVSSIDPGSVSKISIEFPAKAPVVLEKQDGYWHLVQPYKARASQELARLITSILSASSSNKLPGDDLARYDLDQPALKLRLDNEELLFGTHNPLDSRQYVAYEGAVYLLPAAYAELAATQIVEMLDKSLLATTEQITGFDFSRLEQWEPTGLRLDHENGQWKVSIAAAKPVQKEIDDWFSENWQNLTALSVEPYQPDARAKHPTFEIKLKNGKTIHVEKLRESPELQLGRPDEGLIYHFAQDTGFVILNPPIGFKPQ